MTKFKLLNKETLKEGFDFLAKKEPGFKKVLQELVLYARALR